MVKFNRNILVFWVIMGCLYPGKGVFSQETAPSLPEGRTIPEALLQPQRGEAPRFPQDVVIGELGQGNARTGAYFFARALLSALMRENRDFESLSSQENGYLEEIFDQLKLISPRACHLGGGREEPDGSTSFLFRFIGRDQGISGELYLLEEEEKWRLDDLVLEEPRDLFSGEDAYFYDFSPYERFF